MIDFIRGLFMIVRRSLREHLLSSVITVLSLGLGCGLVMAVFNLSFQSEKAFSGGSPGFDAILGPKGSPLQIVLNAVYHMDQSPGNIPWSTYQAVANDRGRVELAIPYVLGDNYRGFRIIGTTSAIFTDFQYQEGQNYRFARGAAFDPVAREAVLGSTVARETGLDVGSIFQPTHGLTEEGGHVHDTDFEVVGVLEPTNTPADRAVWIPADATFRLEGHYLRGGGALFNPAVIQGEYAIGAHFGDYRVIGADPLHVEYAQVEDQAQPLPLRAGRWYSTDKYEVVIGSEVARDAKLDVGSSIEPRAGVVESAGSEPLAKHLVVGVLAATGGPIDREIFAPLLAVQQAPQHQVIPKGEPVPGQAFDEIPDEYKECAAVLIKFRQRKHGLDYLRLVQEQGASTTLVYPVVDVMGRFLERFEVVPQVLLAVAYLVVVVAAGSILASLYNTMNERRREFAILRALGASRRIVFGVIILEAVTLAALGCAVGFLVYGGLMFGVTQFIYESSGVVISPWAYHPVLVRAPIGMLVVGAIAGLLPAWRAYSVDVSEGLSAS